MAYADYIYYTETYLGNTVKEADFPRLAARASEYIDYITQGRAERQADSPRVKNCCCALSEIYLITEQAKREAAEAVETGGGSLKSQSVGGWSQSYTTSAEYSEEYGKKLQQTALQYLAGTGLLYRGRLRCAEECFPTL